VLLTHNRPPSWIWPCLKLQTFQQEDDCQRPNDPRELPLHATEIIETGNPSLRKRFVSMPVIIGALQLATALEYGLGAPLADRAMDSMAPPSIARIGHRQALFLYFKCHTSIWGIIQKCFISKKTQVVTLVSSA
jgi:hypothetical protein